MAQPEERPHLVAVDPAAPAPPAAPDERRRWLAWILGGALVIALILLLAQTQRADRLAGQVDRLGAELSTARGLIDAYQGRMEAVRGHVDDLTARLGSLAELVAEDPAAEADE